METFLVKSLFDTGFEAYREWQAEDSDHTREQHINAFPEETIIAIYLRIL